MFSHIKIERGKSIIELLKEIGLEDSKIQELIRAENREGKNTIRACNIIK